MTNPVSRSISPAQWHALVSEAEAVTGCVLGARLENYLVFLLMRFMNQPHMLARLRALECLNEGQAGPRPDPVRLRDIGDNCLLFTGLFPQHAERHMLRLSAIVELGRNAYQQLAEATRDDSGLLYAHLSQEFVSMMDLLQAMRELRDGHSRLSPLHAFDLWSNTGSRRAYRVIRSFTKALPVKSPAGGEPLLM